MKLIKPLIERPFIPQEVDKLSGISKKKVIMDDNMSPVALVGPRPNGGEENPILYSTIISSKPTSISHPIVQPEGIKMPKQAMEAFKIENNQLQNEVEKLPPGAYSIPVKIQPGTINDPTLSEYVTPNFIQKKAHKIYNTANIEFPQNMKDTVNQDVQMISSQMEAVKNNDDKVKVCKIILVYIIYSIRS
jgi:hypothetical protein